MDVTLRNGKLVAVPVIAPEFTLEELVKQITPKNRHGVTDTLELPSGDLADVVIPLTNPRVPEQHNVMAFTKSLHERWAEFNSRGTLTVDMPELPPPR